MYKFSLISLDILLLVKEEKIPRLLRAMHITVYVRRRRDLRVRWYHLHAIIVNQLSGCSYVEV